MARRGRQILIVDDDPDIARFIGMILGRCGFAVTFARDGQEGIDQARALRPDLVVTNIVMSRIGGIEMTRRIRSDPEIAATPVLILSAKTLPRDKLRALVAGADDYMIKPFDPHDLVAHVTSLFERARKPGYARPLEGNTTATVADALAYLEGLRPEAEPDPRSGNRPGE